MTEPMKIELINPQGISVGKRLRALDPGLVDRGEPQ